MLILWRKKFNHFFMLWWGTGSVFFIIVTEETCHLSMSIVYSSILYACSGSQPWLAWGGLISITSWNITSWNELPPPRICCVAGNGSIWLLIHIFYSFLYKQGHFCLEAKDKRIRPYSWAPDVMFLFSACIIYSKLVFHFFD